MRIYINEIEAYPCAHPCDDALWIEGAGLWYCPHKDHTTGNKPEEAENMDEYFDPLAGEHDPR